MTHRQAVGLLVAVAMVWGTSFVIIKAALAHASPLVFMACRFGIAAAMVLPALRGASRTTVRDGLLLGLLFFAGFVFQTTGLARTTPSRSAFITGMSTALVPIVALVVHRDWPPRRVVLAVLLALAGLYLVTDPGGGGLNLGDLLTIGCAVVFAAHIVAASHFARQHDATQLLAMQLLVTAACSLVAIPILETPHVEWGWAFGVPLLLAAFLGLGTFWGQLRAQAVVTPTEAAIIYTLEPVVASVFSFVVFGETLGVAQVVGAVMILVAMVLPEVGTGNASLAD